jgi:hypothetical protein
MLRYVTQAFWSRPPIAGVSVPWNALAVSAAFGAGFFDARIWIVAAFAEALYLAARIASPGFRRSVDAASPGEDRDGPLASLGTPARQRHRELLEKIQRIERMYRLADGEELLLESNRHALNRMAAFHLQLLTTQRELVILGNAAEEREVRDSIATIERELATQPAESLQLSKEATLGLLRQRLENFTRRDASLAGISADLERIEAHVDVALEQASIQGHPVAISEHIELASQLFGAGGTAQQPGHTTQGKQ